MRLALLLAAAVLLQAGEPRYWYPLPPAPQPLDATVDVCVYGGTPGGIMAAIQAARMGRSAVVLEFGRRIGGMTASGLSATDGGRAIGGLALEFYQGLGARSGFLPHDAEARFTAMLAAAGVPVHRERRLAAVEMDGAAIRAVRLENGDRVRAGVFVDATYEGDLMAMAGVACTVGREPNSRHGETLNGVARPGAHNFRLPVDPFRIPGDPASGLLPGITNPAADAPGRVGEGDRRVQAYNFRMFLARMPDALPFPKPAGYDPGRYEILRRYIAAGAEGGPQLRDMMQLKEGDSNNNGGFSTDHIGGSDRWPEAGYAEREAIYQDHVAYQQGLMWFLANDPAVPGRIRERVSAFGLDRRCFRETGGWPHQLYVREGRRMVADVVMSEAHCRGDQVVDDPVGLAEYTMDSHNCQRFVDRSGLQPAVRNEGDVQVRIPGPYPVSYRAIVPAAGQCPNLLVPVCLSASHIAYGSIRMEPVFMVLGQSAGTAAALAVARSLPVQQIPYGDLRARLLADGQMLAPAPR